jgi:hypothetical protein
MAQAPIVVARNIISKSFFFEHRRMKDPHQNHLPLILARPVMVGAGHLSMPKGPKGK